MKSGGLLDWFSDFLKPAGHVEPQDVAQASACRVPTLRDAPPRSATQDVGVSTRQAESRLRRNGATPVALLGVAALLAAGCASRPHSPPARPLIVLGIDGMDPGFLERHWDSLPNLDRLRPQGDFRRLQTSIPPQSPVAWSTFITGMNPGGHGIFDFVHRDPATLQPFSSLAETVEPKWKLPLGPWELPLSRGKVRLLRRGTAFWQLLSDAGVPVTVLRMPNNFPPDECEGQSLAGMGTPDLRGTFGTFTYFTSDPLELTRDVPGGRIVRTPWKNNRAVLRLDGPPNTLRRDRSLASVDIEVEAGGRPPAARFRTGGTTLVLKEREWSPWIRTRFELIRGLASVAGMFRLYVRQLHPELQLYVSPVNIDPSDPEVPLSTPSSYSREIARAVGAFYTQGISEDTSALRQDVLTLEEFAAQARIVAAEHLGLLEYAGKQFRSGFLFFHFFGVDQASHMFWGKHEPELLNVYRLADDAIGRVVDHAGGATVIVMSDHGFTSFDRAMHLNSWLRSEGLLAMKPQGADLASIDWSRTQAYAMGLNGLYLNQKGREASGIVPAVQRKRILASLRDRLLAARDDAGKSPIEAVYVSEEQFSGAALAQAPDLIIGYRPGYRGSWQTALGEAPPQVYENNTDAWIGDHCVRADRVPGVFLSNRKTAPGDLKLEDLTVSVLRHFGVAPAPGMSGMPIALE